MKGYTSRTSAQSYLGTIKSAQVSSACGSSCGAGDGDKKPEPKPSACGAGGDK